MAGTPSGPELELLESSSIALIMSSNEKTISPREHGTVGSLSEYIELIQGSVKTD